MDFIKLAKERFSARSYINREISSEIEQEILEALRWAPSGKNQQPWKFIVIKDESVKAELKKACKNQKFITQAPFIIVACGFAEKAYPAMGSYWNSVTVDVSIALTYAMLAASSHNIKSCWVGAFYEDEVKKVLNIPENAMVVSIMAFGYTEESRKTDRKPVEEIVCYDRFS